MAITGRRLAEEAAIGIGPPPPPRCCSDSRKVHVFFAVFLSIYSHYQHTRSYFESLEVAQLIGDNYAVLSSVEPDREDEVQSTWEAVFRECKKRGHGWTKSPGKTDANRLHYLKSSKWYMMRIDAWVCFVVGLNLNFF